MILVPIAEPSIGKIYPGGIVSPCWLVTR
jgi:hypothetical protein